VEIIPIRKLYEVRQVFWLSDQSAVLCLPTRYGQWLEMVLNHSHKNRVSNYSGGPAPDFNGIPYLVPIHQWPICPISALREKFNPRNISHMPAIAGTAMLSVKFFARLDLDPICLFLDGHYFALNKST
jgi:hypothetical protein